MCVCGVSKNPTSTDSNLPGALSPFYHDKCPCVSPYVAVMYGLLIEGVCEALKERFGAEKWNEIREWAGVTQHAFVTHDRYSEAIVQRLARATTELTDMHMTQVMELCGMSFVDLLSR